MSNLPLRDPQGGHATSGFVAWQRPAHSIIRHDSDAPGDSDEEVVMPLVHASFRDDGRGAGVAGWCIYFSVTQRFARCSLHVLGGPQP